MRRGLTVIGRLVWIRRDGFARCLASCELLAQRGELLGRQRRCVLAQGLLLLRARQSLVEFGALLQ